VAEAETYNDWLKKDYIAIIDGIGLLNEQKHFMKSRWLDQVMWMEGKSAFNQKWYYRLRISAIVGGVMVPALTGLGGSDGLSGILQVLVFCISLIVAVSITIEEFFHFGDRWRHYRSNLELLKTEGWSFFQLSGQYDPFENHKDGYPKFAQRVEELLTLEMNVFIAEVTKEDKSQPENK